MVRHNSYTAILKRYWGVSVAMVPALLDALANSSSLSFLARQTIPSKSPNENIIHGHTPLRCLFRARAAIHFGAGACRLLPR